jgi:hypothetical protein
MWEGRHLLDMSILNMHPCHLLFSEVSAEQQAQLDRFPDNNRQRGRMQNNRGCGPRGGFYQQGGRRFNQGQGPRFPMDFGNFGRPGDMMPMFRPGQMMPMPGMRGPDRMPHPRNMSPGRMPGPGPRGPLFDQMLFQVHPDTGHMPPPNLMQMGQNQGPRPGMDRDVGMGRGINQGPMPLFPEHRPIGMQRGPRMDMLVGQQQQALRMQQGPPPQPLMRPGGPQNMGMQPQPRPLLPMGMQQQQQQPLQMPPAVSSVPLRPHTIHINPNFRGPIPGSRAAVSVGMSPQPIFSQPGVRMVSNNSF